MILNLIHDVEHREIVCCILTSDDAIRRILGEPIEISPEQTRNTAIIGGGALALWLSLKLFSPACGPAAPICAAVL